MKYLVPVLSIMLLSVGCSGQDKKAEEAGIAKRVDVGTFRKLIAEKPGQIVDVRSPGEFEAGAIEEAVLINWYDPEFNSKANELNKEKPVYIYCQSGGRSRAAMKRLVSLGFTEVYELAGGYSSWVRN